MIKYADMWDMSLEKELPGHIPHLVGNILWGFLFVVMKIAFRYHVDGLEKLRAFKGTGAVIVCNHTSFLDVVFIYLSAHPKQWLRFMARDTMFGNAHGLAGQVISRCGAFPVTRDSADRTSIKRAAKMLKSGEQVLIMPEGTRRGKTDMVPEIHAGAAFIAKMGKAPILPMTVRNLENVKKKGQRVHFPKVTLEYGNPVLLEDFDFLPKPDRLEGCAWYAMREVFALNQNVPRQNVDMKALFPNGRDFSQIFAEHPIPSHEAAEVARALRQKKAAKEE